LIYSKRFPKTYVNIDIRTKTWVLLKKIFKYFEMKCVIIHKIGKTSRIIANFKK